MLELRDYQKQAIEEIEGAIAFGAEHLILDAPVSYGKSIVIAELCNVFHDKNIVILLNIEALIDQIAEALQQRGVEYSILKAGRNDEFDESKRVQIVFSQTFYARYQKVKLKCDLLLKDEEHIEYSTQRTQRAISTLKPEVRIGFTGTAYDSTGFALHNAEVISTISMKELIQQQYLSEVKFYTPYLAEKKTILK
jgi:superfamily II DNA or RNA helicase